MEYELLHLGRGLSQLGSKKLTWHDLSVITLHPRKGLPLHAALLGDEAKWDHLDVQILAGILDAINRGNWQRGGDPNAPEPEPLNRPGVDGYQRTVDAVADEDAYDIDDFPMS